MSDVWELVNLVRCAFCWRPGLPEQGWQQRWTEGDGTRCPHWFCPEHAAMVDRHHASQHGLIDGAGI